jgi:4-diphosphocytidyl-2-C-methyl-D-erythritol kinase
LRVTALRDRANAKLNLTLEVLGRRTDGYHELASLVAFATLSDTVELVPRRGLALEVAGPFAAGLEADNLILTAAMAAKAAYSGLTLGSFKLDKALPVAAGLGGGSADAAAALRLLARANPGTLDDESWRELAEGLGSDVPVCLVSRPALMTGRGETVTRVRGFPACGAVLANPRVPLAASEVYGALVSSDLAAPRQQSAETLDFGGSFDQVVGYAAARRNDLEPAALSLAPVIANILAALRRCQGARLTRLSGSGSTCFALFATAPEAETAAASLRSLHPEWWVEATSLLGA